jgi:mono/diheme cytochrome c family protein
MRRLSMLAVCLLLVATGSGAWACGEHGRRLAGEFHLLAGDARLLEEGTLPAHQQRGLRARLENILGYLPLLARYYAQECGRSAAPLLEAIEELRGGYAAAAWPVLLERLAELQRDYPLDLLGILAVRPDPAQIAAGAEIYRTLCQGCHQQPDSSRDNPARDLFASARLQGAEEFAARLLLGVRGVPLTSLENSLADPDLASLQAFLTRGGGAP